MLTCDRGSNKQGEIAPTVAKSGVTTVRQVGVESPEQFGRVERHGGLFKAVLTQMFSEHCETGLDDMRIAAAEATTAIHNPSRNGGSPPSQ